MKVTPMVSVIIPTYNCADWLMQSIDSVFFQSYKNIEVIVIDDGSTDNTFEILSKLINNKKIKYFYQNNKGPAAARNLGIKNCNGKYIAFLDSDDLWKKDKIEKQVNFLEHNKEYGLVLTNIEVIDENNNILYVHKKKISPNKIQLLTDFFMGKITMNTPTIFVYRSIVEEIGGFNENLIHREDHFFLMNVVEKYKIKLLDDCLTERRIRKDSMSRVDFINPESIITLYSPFIEMSTKSYPFLEKHVNKAFSRIYIDIAKKYFKASERKLSFKYVLESTKADLYNYNNYIMLLILLIPLSYSSLAIIKNKILSLESKNKKIK